MLKWIVVSVVLDRVTKWMIAANLERGQSIEVAGQALRLTYVTNTGAAFGMLRDHTMLLAAVSAILIVLIVVWHRSWVPAPLKSPAAAAAGLLVGGALGNLVDRMVHGYVIDFIDLGFWPVFNVADIAVVVGCGLLFVLAIRHPEIARGGDV